MSPSTIVPPPERNSVRRLLSPLATRPDLLASIVVAAIAAAWRLVFLPNAPMYLGGDSLTYFEAAYGLAQGGPLALPPHRAPGYPLFLAATMRLFGPDIYSIGVTQHVLGVVTAVLTYHLGRLVFNRRAGFVAAFLTAVSAPLLLYEHYIMAEPLFTLLVTLCVLLFVVGWRGGAPWPLAAAGIALGLAYQTRPIGQAVLPALLLAFVIRPTSWRARFGQAELLVLGFLIVAAPTLIWNRMRAGEPTPVVGTHLYGRIVRHDDRFSLPSPDHPPAAADERQVAARRLIIEHARLEEPPSVVRLRLAESLGMNGAEAERAMRAVALEILLDQPDRYVIGTFEKVGSILLGNVEELTLKESSRFATGLDETDAPTEARGTAQPIAGALLAFFQPARHRLLLGALVALGLLSAAGSTRYRVGLILALVSIALILPSAAVVGDVFRYRYPADPLLAVLAGGGLMVAITWARRFAGRRRSRPDRAQSTSAAVQASWPGRSA